MLGALPPYALTAPVFRFPALAALAGRRPLGSEREIVLAALVCAHLAVGALPECAVPIEACERRAAGARAWLAAIALPASARAAVARVIDAAARADAAALRQTLDAFTETVSRALDPPSRRELEQLGVRLGAIRA